MNENNLIKRSDPKYDDDLINLRYIKTILFDFYHPIGEIFTIKNSDFNPNKEWNGKWILDSNTDNIYKWERIK